jgi:HSP20 family protein
MKIKTYDPLRHFDQLKKNVNQLFDQGFGFIQEFGSAAPRMDVHETADSVIATCEIPGLSSKEDVQIQVHDNQLTIRGTIQHNEEVKEENMHRKERFSGRFQRSVALPVHVQAEGTTASYRNGILEVRMPKSFGDDRNKIDVEFH